MELRKNLTLSFRFLIIIITHFQILHFPIVLCNDDKSPEELELQAQKVFLRSYYSLKVLVLREEIIYNELKHLYELKEIPASLEWYFEDYLDSCKLVKLTKPISSNSKRDDIIAGHPLLAYRMIYRYVVHLRPIIDDLKFVAGVNGTLQSYLNSIEGSVGWPHKADVENAMTAILRLQHVYDLNITEFLFRNVSNFKRNSYVQAIHCYELGMFAIKERYFAIAVEWFEFGKSLVENGIDQTIDLETLNVALRTAVTTHDLEWDKDPSYVPEYFTYKLETMVNYTDPREKRRTYHSNYWKDERAINFNTINFWKLCSGDDMRTDEEKSDLFCWYDTKSNPVWKINPLKIEQLGKTPSLFQFYEVLSNSLIEKLITKSQPDLIKSQVYSNAYHITDDRKETAQRTSLNTWLDDSNVMELMMVPKQIELITGLVVLPDSSSENIQVATYTFGGHYEVHQDAFNDKMEYFNSQKGERMATFMIYLSDVEKGGYTAFPQAGIAARPVKGSAVFWYNTKRNGEVDENTWHGACPVLQGSKWVANKWIRAHDQFLTRPCSINPDV